MLNVKCYMLHANTLHGTRYTVEAWTLRDSNEAKYLQEALGMIDDFQRRNSQRGSARQGTVEATLVERQQ